ncbi:nucleotidyltransferase [Dehalogenimonas sp. 4OHTPN]|uniref:Nucleotidyltransferase n=1 Tax=Dehalogenimonas sp. 4OHTPN TaxID=3166643 RepID=A0AAU8GBV9_9CHLR
MAISEAQLNTWSHQGPTTSSSITYESIRYALRPEVMPSDIEFDIYLQGSYKNNTNTRGDSDVDIVVELTSSFWSNLNDIQKKSLGITPSNYGWDLFRSDVISALTSQYGPFVKPGNKCINIDPSSGRIPADIVVSIQYRWYDADLSLEPINGIAIKPQNKSDLIISYPKIHYDKCVDKNERTGEWFKRTVRLFKNIRNYLSDNNEMDIKAVPSYLLESLLFNVPDSQFGNTFQHTFCNTVNWLYTSELTICTFPSLRGPICGNGPEQWHIDQAKGFVNKLIEFWNSN